MATRPELIIEPRRPVKPRHVGVKMEQGMFRFLEGIAREKDTTVSHVIRAVIGAYKDQEEEALTSGP